MHYMALREDFIKPEYKTDGSAGFDIYCQEDTVLVSGMNTVVNLGFAAEVPEGHVALLLPRSSTGIKGVSLRNTIGVIDSDYRGEWIANLVVDEISPNTWGETLEFKKGDRILQCVILPINQVKLEQVQSLTETKRNKGGFGSTDVVK